MRDFIRAQRAARSDAGAPVADAIRIGEPAIEVRLRRSARARRMVLRVAHAGRGPTLTLPPGVPLAAGAGLPQRPRGLAAAAPRGAPGAARRSATGTRAAVRRRHADDPRGTPGGRIVRAGGVLSVPGPSARRGAARRRLAARGGAAGLRRGGRAARRRRWGCGRGGSACAIRGRAGGRARRAGDLMFSWRLVMAPRGGARLRGGARGGASGRAEPFAAVLGGGAAALPGLSSRARDWLRRNGASLHGHDFGAAPA